MSTAPNPAGHANPPPLPPKSRVGTLSFLYNATYPHLLQLMEGFHLPERETGRVSKKAFILLLCR